MPTHTDLTCRCGEVHLTVESKPMLAVECQCESCRKASAFLSRLPGATAVSSATGGTQYVLYRKDRIRIVAGREWLRNFRLGPHTATRRVIATCCNSPVLVEFKGGHWASLYGNLWATGTLPRLDLRTQTGDAPPGTGLDRSVPAGGWETAKFYGKLFAAWAAMGFRSPPLALDTPEIELPASAG